MLDVIYITICFELDFQIGPSILLKLSSQPLVTLLVTLLVIIIYTYTSEYLSETMPRRFTNGS